MARTKLQDLTIDQTLDAEALERVRGGLNFASTDGSLNFAQGSLNFSSQKVHDISFLKISGYDL